MAPGIANSHRSSAQLIESRHYNVHGMRLAIRSQGREAAECMEHRLRLFVSPPAEADMVVDILVAQAGMHPVSLPNRRARVLYTWQGGAVHYEEQPARLTVSWSLDEVRAELYPDSGLVTISLDPARLDGALRGAANQGLMYPLLEMLKRRGLYFIHGAALDTPSGRGVLITGNSGSGKSTSAVYLSVCADYRLVADDTLFLRWQAGEPALVGLPDDIRLNQASRDLLPALADGVPRPLLGRSTLRLDQLPRLRVVESVKPEIVLFPTIGPGPRCHIQEVSRGEALVELARHVMMTDAEQSQAHLDALAGLARRCHAYRLELGPRLDTLPALIESVVGAF